MTRLFDLDLWRAAAPGRDEQFDADRFGTWLEVMVDAGVSSAAATLAAMDVDLLVAAGFAEHIRVFDDAAVTSFITLDGEVAAGESFAEGVRAEIGGYVVVAKRVDYWDAITAVLNALADAHDAVFDRVMRGCCRLSSSRPEIDGLDDLLTANEQAMFDVALDREARGDAQGYVTPAQARAFLQMSGGSICGMARCRLVTRLRARTSETSMPQARTGRDGESRQLAPQVEVAPVQQPPADAMTAIVELLHDEGVIPRAPRALLEAAQQTGTTSRPDSGTSWSSRTTSTRTHTRRGTRSWRTWRTSSPRVRRSRRGRFVPKRRRTPSWASATSDWRTGRFAGCQPRRCPRTF